MMIAAEQQRTATNAGETAASALSWLCFLALTWLVFTVYRDLQQRPRPTPASCSALYRLSHSASDSLYVAIARGDCAR